MTFFKGHLELWANVTVLADGFPHTVTRDSQSIVEGLGKHEPGSVNSLLIGVCGLNP